MQFIRFEAALGSHFAGFVRALATKARGPPFADWKKFEKNFFLRNFLKICMLIKKKILRKLTFLFFCFEPSEASYWRRWLQKSRKIRINFLVHKWYSIRKHLSCPFEWAINQFFPAPLKDSGAGDVRPAPKKISFWHFAEKNQRWAIIFIAFLESS